MPTVFGILLILASVFLIVSVLLQGGKSNNRLSGAIAGGAETFFGKSKADSMEKKLSKVTAVVAVVFAVLVLVLYIIQDNVDYSDYSVPTESSGTTVDAGEETTDAGAAAAVENGDVDGGASADTDAGN